MEIINSVLVVIINYNSGRWIRKTLDALLIQTLKPSKIIVVDNNSTDDSLSCISDYKKVVNIECNQNNIGYAAANNQAVGKFAGYKWVALLNPDAVPDENWLKNLINAADNANLNIGSFASVSLCEDNLELLDGAGDCLHASGIAWRQYYRDSISGKNLNKQNVFSACGAAVLYRKEAWDLVGGFDEKFFCYLEDVDLGFRMRLVGYECMLVPDAVVKHVGSATTGKRSDFTIYYGHRNMVWNYVKNMPGILFYYYLPLHIAANIMTAMLYLKRGRFKLICKAKVDAIKGLKTTWRKRQFIQKERKATISQIRAILDNSLLNIIIRFKKGMNDTS